MKSTRISWILAPIAIVIFAPVCFAQSVGDVREVATVDMLPRESVYNKIWQPFIAEWSSGQYVVAYGLQLTGKVDMGDIVCSISKDAGKTWSAPVMIFDHRIPNGTQRFAYNNAVLFRPENQDVLWCFAMRTPLQYRDSEDGALCAAYSSDGGLSWLQVELTNDFHSPLITCAGVVPVREGDVTRYLLPAHRNTKRRDPKGDREHFVLESTNLLHWKLAGYIPRPSHVWIHEGNIAEGDGPDELKIVMRTAQYEDSRRALETPRAYSSVSRDQGRTWSVAVEESALYNTAAKGFFGRDRTGRHVYVYNDGERGARKGLYYTVKPAGGAWSAPKLFYWNNDRNSYPTLLERIPGVFLCVWDSSDDPEKKRTVIRFGILDLNE